MNRNKLIKSLVIAYVSKTHYLLVDYLKKLGVKLPKKHLMTKNAFNLYLMWKSAEIIGNDNALTHKSEYIADISKNYNMLRQMEKERLEILRQYQENKRKLAEREAELKAREADLALLLAESKKH